MHTRDSEGSGHAELDPRRRRLLFRAQHRGTHEADLLVGGYVASHVAAFSEADMVEMEAVLELPDVELADWLCGRTPIPAAQDCALLRAMREHAGSAMHRSRIVGGE